MARYNGTSLALAEEAAAQDCFLEVEGYLSSEDGYWLSHDIWMKDSETFAKRGISLDGARGDVVADFSTAPAGRVRTELKYYALWSLSMGVISASTFTQNYRSALMDLGVLLQARGYTQGLTEVVLTEEELSGEGWAEFRKDTIPEQESSPCQKMWSGASVRLSRTGRLLVLNGLSMDIVVFSSWMTTICLWWPCTGSIVSTTW